MGEMDVIVDFEMQGDSLFINRQALFEPPASLLLAKPLSLLQSGLDKFSSDNSGLRQLSVFSGFAGILHARYDKRQRR